MKKYTCYHFTNAEGKLGYGDGRHVAVGETLSVDGKPSICEYGLHGSESVVDALRYGNARLWLVEIWGSVDIGSDKLCGKHRAAIVDYGNVLPLIVEFAKWCAVRAASASAYDAAYIRDNERAEQNKWWAEKLNEIAKGKRQ